MWPIEMNRVRFLTLLIICCGLLQEFTAGGHKKKAVGFILLVSNSSSYHSINSVEAVRDGVDDVNRRNGLLADYQLEISEVISQQDPNGAIERILSAFLNSPIPSVAIIDGGYPGSENILMSLSGLLKIPIITYSPFHLTNNDGTLSLFSNMNDMVVALSGYVKHSGWEQVAMISEIHEIFLKFEQSFINEFKSADSVAVDTLHVSALQSNWSQLFETKYRVTILNTFEDTTRKILCEAYKRLAYYPYYTWIILGWYSEDWLARDSSEGISCTNAQMIKVVERAIVIQQGPIKEKNKICLNHMINQTTLFSSLAYDAVTTFALALNRSITDNELFIQQCGTGEISFNKTKDCKMVSGLIDVTLQGRSGPISFDQNHYRIVESMQYMQFRSGRDNNCIDLEQFGVFHICNGSVTYNSGANISTVWPGGIPYDGSPITKVTVVDLSATVILYLLATLGIVFTIFCLIFNIIFKDKKIIRLTTPNLNYFIIAGALILYSCICIRMARTSSALFWKINCHTIIWTLFIGYTLCFGPYLAKIWRIYYIFHNPMPKKKKVLDKHLVFFVVVETAVVLLLLIFGTGLPFTRPRFYLAVDPQYPSMINEEGVEVEYLNVNCTTAFSYLWIGVGILFFAVQHGYAIFVAIRIRKVKIKVLNEYKAVSATIYISTITMTEGLALSFILRDFDTLVESLVCTALIIIATTYVGFTFIPKMRSLYNDPEGKNIFTHQDNLSTCIASSDKVDKIKTLDAKLSVSNENKNEEV